MIISIQNLKKKKTKNPFKSVKYNTSETTESDKIQKIAIFIIIIKCRNHRFVFIGIKQFKYAIRNKKKNLFI